VLAALALTVAPAAAQRKSAPFDAEAYNRCMNLADTRPAEAQKMAQQARTSGGGYAAEHCEAAARTTERDHVARSTGRAR